MSTRRATHADSWYSNNAKDLNAELDGYLNAVEPSDALGSFPIAGIKAVIAPHAGYSYSGPAAAWAYKTIDTSGIKRVFILGPAHHVYMDGCALSTFQYYDTPLGSLPLDRSTIAELRETGYFSDMDAGTDEDEHSIEMHLPYVRKIFEGSDICIVPILVGAIDKDRESFFGKVIAPFLARDDTFCVVSSDFCHWGSRFSFTSYYPEPPNGDTTVVRLSRSNKSVIRDGFPIHASISALDHQAMSILTLPPSTAKQAHENFAQYIGRTKNTICGRHPIGVLLGAVSELENHGRNGNLRWLRYEQSSQCKRIEDSSVSYASACVTF
ncbi:UPF0103-domain-containing protein [Rickenella mellea]|uniref:UPF0103-domain-containing protein n=1 Tax=Rickenella mellea TaxID=50990 RepID=A0A4Y7QM64_9AGAM|nr:UPF0103-domain-containing protein [Rickenella mellea]